MKTAQLLTFPLERRRALVARLAARMLARPPKEAEKHLAFELERHRRSLARKRLPIEAIDIQISEFQAAVRSELGRLVLAPPQPRSGG